MTSGGDGADLEVIAIDGDAPGQGPDRAGRNTHRVGVTVAAVTIVALAVLVSALSLNRPGRRSGRSPAPTPEEINARPSVQRSELVTVLSTLLIAAIAAPLRRRLQSAIDHRFYRQRYDAARTLAGFGATLRDNVDLDHLSERLLAVVDDTMQPADVSLWIRPPPS